MQVWQIQNLMRVVTGLDTQGIVAVQVQDSLPDFLPGQGKSFSVLLKPSTNWLRPTYILEGNLLYSKFTHLNVILTQKHLHKNI